jgi:hypothetical protein
LKGEEQTLSTDAITALKEIYNKKSGISSTKDHLLFIKYITPIIYRKSGGKVHIIKDGNTLNAGCDKEPVYKEDKSFIFIAKSFYWSKLINDGLYKNSGDISRAHNCTSVFAKRALRQRYLSPKIIERIVKPTEYKQIGVDNMIDFNHWCWEIQEKALLN